MRRDHRHAEANPQISAWSTVDLRARSRSHGCRLIDKCAIQLVPPKTRNHTTQDEMNNSTESRLHSNRRNTINTATDVGHLRPRCRALQRHSLLQLQYRSRV
ncbi:hypothetical protein LMG28138_02487 [Pararobbsia alpina]|uniref:Uncharacterized protein n=1 Tax=Pararobbsia alpina TaxID=621374 RepID=A0A6S7B6X7_9BURK|nr:hypothetical protein LMG28138_02487 [Pararobbsia alpina]